MIEYKYSKNNETKNMKRLWPDTYDPYTFHLPTFWQETKGQLPRPLAVKRQEDLMVGIPVSIVLSWDVLKWFHSNMLEW